MDAKVASQASIVIGILILAIAILNVAGNGRFEVMAALMISASIIIAGGLIAWAVSSRGGGR